MAHARAIHVFFTTHVANRYQYDVLAEDYGFPANQIYSDKDRPRFFDRFDKDLMHISYSRLRHTVSTKPWPLNDILRPIMARCEDFISHIVALPWKSIGDLERNRWRELIPNFRVNIPIQQNTSNIAMKEVESIEVTLGKIRIVGGD